MFSGSAFYLVSAINYFSTPLDQPINRGIYRITRNPLYVSGTVIFIGTAFILHSAVIGASIVLNVTLQHFVILDEELFCRKKYGESYCRL